MSEKTADNSALLAILAQPDTVLTHAPPRPGGLWKATLRKALGPIGEPIRPHFYVGAGETEQAAIDHLKALETADTWAAGLRSNPGSVL